MKSRYWFLLSVMLFIAAAFVWHKAEQHRLSQPGSAKDAPASQRSDLRANKTAKSSTAPGTSSKNHKPKSLANSSTNNSVAANSTNSAALYPNRLKNTAQTLEQLVQNDHAILLRNALIDTDGESVKIPDELRSKGDPGSYIVQARGVVDASFRAALMEANAKIISYVPNNAYLVRLPNGMAKLANNKQVQSVLPYEPYYKLDTDLLAMVMDKKPMTDDKIVRVGLFPGQRDSAVEALKGHAQIVGEDPDSSPFGPELIVSSADLVQLANMPQVQEIEPYYERQVMNDLTRVRLGVSSDPVTPDNFLNLTGANILVNVNDTTIDATNADLFDRVTIGIGDGTDEDGHGTHVAGIIASSGATSPTGDLTQIGSVAGANFRGKAPAASLLSLDIFAPSLTDAKMQITAASTNYIELDRKSPLISNNSWGYGTHTYNSSAASFDAAVRDALPGSIGSQPIAFVFAAGNGGDGGVPGTITSPGTAKNVISVGAIESKRDLTNDVVRPNSDCVVVTNKEFLDMTDSSNEVADFSSRGNVGISQEGEFGRFKPDVVAPGTFIASTRSQQFDEASYYSPLHVDRNVHPNLVLDPVSTNNTVIAIPDDPCDEGTTMSLTISATPTSPTSTNVSLLIYAGSTPKPSTSPTNLRGVNTATIDRADLPLGGVLFYDIVNTNDFEVTYDLETSLVLSNDFGDTVNGYFAVLRTLNDYLAPNDRFESGTSMSAPAISGMLALMQEFFEQRFQITNSPAMMKALLINGSRSIGSSGYHREASLNNAGWGLPDLRRILPANDDRTKWPVQLFDQSTNFALATGDRHDRVVTINDTNSPLRVTLVWTDPPGNPAVGVKLVNDLDLVVTSVATNALDTNGLPVTVTNVYIGNNFLGGEFVQPSVMGTNGLSDFEAIRDKVNNVENVYINGPLGAQYTVSVIGHRVNVNAVTAHTNGIVQDYALVISGDIGTNAPFAIDTNNIVALPNTNAFVTVISNTFPAGSYGAYLSKQHVGANSPLQNVKPTNLTDGTNTQWAFYVLNNPSNFANVAFVTFLPPNLSGASNTVPGSRRVIEADIDMYVSTDPSLTNLNPAAIAGADKSLKRGGQELVVYTNRTDPVFYVGIKSEDQRAAEFSFFAVASATRFSDEENGNLILHGIPAGGVDVPDGTPDNPGGAPYIMIATSDAKIGRVVVTNTITHERIGDLLVSLSHAGSSGENSVALLNHSFPNGQETGTYTGIYDDSGLDDIFGSRRTDGPGSLLDFVGTEAAGAWILSTEDNSIPSTGRVDFVSVFIERALDTNDLAGGDGFTISGGIPGNSSRALSFIVPENATNMIIEISPKEGALDTVIRRGRLAPTRAPYVDKGALISPPGGQLTVGATDTPPLTPGRYVLRLFNDAGVFVNFTGVVRFQLDLTAKSLQTYVSSGATLLDDAVTNSIIHVNREGRVVSTEVSVRIDHPRVSDLVLHLVSPQGTRILLAENRGGLSTNGYGFSNLQTNVFPATTSGDANADTNVLGPTLKSGIVNVDYDFFEEPDQLRVYYNGRRIFDSGMISGAGRLSIPYGPGNDTSVVIIMNEDGNSSASTMWNYTASVLSGDFVYATFSENTNLALVPIKFAIPPFATNVPGSNAMTFDSSYFEAPTVAGTYASPGTVDGWTVMTNSVDVIADAARAHRGTNFLSLTGGAAVSGADIIAGPILNPANGHYYFLLSSNTWTASEARAIALGGHLATINDAAENSWVFSTFGSYGGISRALWIGLNDIATEGTYTWISGETATYRNWSPLEPNQYYGQSDDFVHIWPPGDPNGRDAKWNDNNDLSDYVLAAPPATPLHGVVEADSVAGATGITRTLPTVAGEFYNLKFAYRRSDPGSLSSANITLDGIFTNEFIGNPSWIVHSTSFVAPKNGTRLDIASAASSAGDRRNLIRNGSFEQGLTGWASIGDVEVNGYSFPPSDGANVVMIGDHDSPGAVLSQNFAVTGGEKLILSFDYLMNGVCGIIGSMQATLTSSLGTVLSQTYTRPAQYTSPVNYQSISIPFTVPLGNTSMTLTFRDLSPSGGLQVDPIVDNVKITGDQPAMLFDTFELSEGGDPNYFLPEESLKTLIGENAKGDWKLEVWDNRVGAPLGAAQLINWQLHLTFASTNATATKLTNGTQVINTVAGGEIKYFIVDVPIFATHATNVLVSGGGPLNLLFNQDELPVGNVGNGDVTLLPGTANGTALLTTTTFPDLRPGGRYYLGVQNANPAQTNFFTLTVTFDDTNNLVNVTPLTNATPYSDTLPIGGNMRYFQYDLSNSAPSIQFGLFNLSGDADLVVKRGQLPTKSDYDFNSNLGGTNDEVIPVANPAPGRYYIGVYGFSPSNSIAYTVMVTEGGVSPAPLLSGEPTLSAGGFHVTANTIIDRDYQFEVSLDLVNWTTISTTTATANITTFTDPTPPSTQTARFYRLTLLP